MRIIAALAAVLALASCNGGKMSEKECMDFLYDGMPLPDSLVHPRTYWEENVRKTLEVRDRMNWNIPDREFRHFVLPLRVNNEDLDNFRLVYADTLCSRVKGLSLAEAALEINHWCHEQATYKPSDARTLGPEALVKSGSGRCGEESVLAVSALRAAGIPARQVYTPRWAHTDDNHAWVEVWVDGKWHFMGACEPEPVLDLAWFNSPVSRAMLLHTKVFGNSYDGDEDVIDRKGAYTEINVIKGYIPARRNTVTVCDLEGNPVADADVEFKIYNYAEFYTVARYRTDSEGKASLDTGLGDVIVWASKGNKYGIGVVSSENGKVVLDRTFGEAQEIEIDIVPPVENPLPDLSTEQQKSENAIRLAQEDAIREGHPHPKAVADGLYLSEKDLIDVTQSVLEDAKFEQSSSDKYVVSPRIEREALMPFRQEIRTSGIGERIASASEAVQWVKDNIKIDSSRNPQVLRIPPVIVWRSRIADEKSRNIFFVALCRALDFPARLDPVDGTPQWRDANGSWVAVDFGSGKQETRPCGTLKLDYVRGDNPVKTPKYYYHFTISEIRDGRCHLLEFDDKPEGDYTFELPKGEYMLCSGMRMADGSVKAKVRTFSIVPGTILNCPLELRNSPEEAQVIGTMDAEKTFLPAEGTAEVSILSATGRGYFLLCVLGDRDEPSIHASGQLEECSGLLNEWGRKVVILSNQRIPSLANAVYGSDPDGKIASMLRKGVESTKNTLPIIALCDSFGRIIYYTEGYDTALSQRLKAVIPQCISRQKF